MNEEEKISMSRNATEDPAPMDLTIVRRPLAWFIPYARNPRKNDAAVDQMCAAIREFGFTIPILARSSGDVIDGHLRLKAAQKLGITEIPVILCDHWTEAQVKAFRLLVNRSANWAQWDAELVALELSDLKEFQFNIDLIGFSNKEMREFEAASGANMGLTDENAAPEPPSDPVSKTGDLWILGSQRILCGDSSNPEDVTRLMNGEKAALMATDPPYLVDYKGGNHPQSWANKPDVKDKHWDDYVDPDKASDFFRVFIAVALLHLQEYAAIYQWHASSRQALVQAAWEQNGLHLHQTIVWVKARPVLTRCHFMWQFEPAFYGWVKGKSPKVKPPANSRNVWEIDQQGEQDGIHPTQKPVELFRRPLLFHTREGGLAYEPFSGSGTAIIAAEGTRRRVYAMELSPQFVDVAVVRWQEFTGQQATLEGDGATFSEIAARRGKGTDAKPKA
jgi:DNA modification methylase